MHIIILGAGSVGTHIASVLAPTKHNLVLVDKDERLLEDLQEHHDIMTVAGNGAFLETLKRAGIAKADILIAVTANSEANMLACQIAKHFEVSKTICRVSSMDFFSEDVGLTPEAFGITEVIVPTEQCAQEILDTLHSPELKELVHFSTEQAMLASFLVRPDSPLAKIRLDEFPEKELISQIRICAILRRGRLIIPRGDTRLFPYDEIYVGGSEAAIQDLLEFAFNSRMKTGSVIISGITPLSERLAELIVENGMDVTLIEMDSARAEAAVSVLPEAAMVIHGDATEPRILDEAGISSCDVFVSTVNDETSILTCLLAKKSGAKKVFAVANKAEYLEIIAGISAISTAFSLRVAAVNEVLNHVRSNELKAGVLLKRVAAEVMEFEVASKSKVAGRMIKDLGCPAGGIVALVIRGSEVIPATGELELKVGDHVVTLAKRSAVARLEQIFSRKSLF